MPVGDREGKAWGFDRAILPWGEDFDVGDWSGGKFLTTDYIVIIWCGILLKKKLQMSFVV